MAAPVALPEGFTLDAPETAGLPAGFTLDGAPAQEDPADVKAQQQEILDRMEDPLGLSGGGDTGAGISLGEAVTSAPFWAGVGKRFVEAKRGVAQLFSSKAEAENLARLTAEEAADLKAHHERNPADAAAYNLGSGTATIAETVTAARYIPGAKQVGLGGTGVAKAAARVGYGGAVGGTYAATHVTEPEQSKAAQVTVGVGFGAIPAVLIEGVAAAARPLASRFTTAAQAKESGGLLKGNPAYERGLALEEATGVKLTPGQATGSPSLSEMRPPQGFAEKQAKQTLRYFVSLRDKVARNAKPPPELAQRYADATDDIAKQLVEARKKVGDFRYGQFRKSVKEVYADRLMQKMDDIANDAVPGTEAGKITLLRDKLAKQLDESGGSLTPEQVLGWKERIDALLSGKSDIFKDLSKANQRRLGGQLMDSLYDSLTATADTLALQGKVSPANLLKQAVADYKKYSAPLRALEESALGAIFRTQKLTPEAAGRKLMSLEPTQVKAVFSILEQHRPDLVQQYQATKLFQALRTSVATTPDTAGRLATQTKFDPKAALRELKRKDSLGAIFDHDPALAGRVRRGVALLDRVSDRLTTASGGRQGVVSREAELAGVAVSGHPVFLARFGAKILGPIGLWKLTTSEKGIQALRTLATAPLKSAQFAAAAESLVMNLDDEASVADDATAGRQAAH